MKKEKKQANKKKTLPIVEPFLKLRLLPGYWKIIITIIFGIGGVLSTGMLLTSAIAFSGWLSLLFFALVIWFVINLWLPSKY